MPEIAATALPSVPIAPATTPAAPAAAAGAAAGPQEASIHGGPGASDTPDTSFLGQLKVALAGLNRAPAQPTAPTAAPLAPAADAAAEPIDGSSPVEPDAQADSSAATTSTPVADQAMAELLAALGLVALPPTLTPAMLAQQAQATAAATVGQGQGSASQPTLPVMAQAATLLASPAQAPAGSPVAPAATQPADAAPAQAAPVAAAAPLAVPTGSATAAGPDLEAALAQVGATAPAPTPGAQLSQSTSPTPPLGAQAAPASASDSTAVAAANVAAAQVLPAAPAPHATPAPGAPTASATPLVATTVVDGSAQSAPTQADTQHAGHSSQDAAGGAQQPDAADPSAVNQALVAPLTAQVTPTGAENAHPSEVVSQIAQQADLYRLPGNKGLRIQLHPDDLGGVQVTVKYSATGGLELHVTAERAETGSLVEAGWSQLRDALATHGISPERVVVSVAAPSSATGTDLSGGNPGGRSGAGQAAFDFAQGQNQSGRQREDADSRSGASWGRPFPSSNPQVAPAAATRADRTSRIDYRA